jgi:hypothetical protein
VATDKEAGIRREVGGELLHRGFSIQRSRDVHDEAVGLILPPLGHVPIEPCQAYGRAHPASVLPNDRSIGAANMPANLSRTR